MGASNPNLDPAVLMERSRGVRLSELEDMGHSIPPGTTEDLPAIDAEVLEKTMAELAIMLDGEYASLSSEEAGLTPEEEAGLDKSLDRGLNLIQAYASIGKPLSRAS